MNIELMVFLCIYICACIIGFDLLFSFYVRREQAVKPKRTKKMLELMKWQIESIERTNHLDKKVQSKIEKRLKREGNLLVFMEILAKMREAELLTAELYLCESTAMLQRLCGHYRRQTAEKRAYFAYAVSVCRLGRFRCRFPQGALRDLARLEESLLLFLMHPSVYVRENALKAILSLGDDMRVSEAIWILNRNPENQSEKRLGDDLLSFAGDHRQLGKRLWSGFSSYAPVIQIGILNYLRLLFSEDDWQSQYQSAVLAIMESEEHTKDVRLAALRYFRKYPCSEAYPCILRFLELDSSQNWEYAAVAAMVLQSYPGEQTKENLLEKIGSPNWYVRYNSAESLLELGFGREQLSLRSGDRFAKDMMAYRAEVKKLKKRREW